MRYYVEVEGRTVVVEVDGVGITVDGRSVRAELQRVGGTNVRSLLLENASHRVVTRRGRSGTWEIHLRGRAYSAEAVDERTRRIREMTGKGAKPGGPRPLKAPMPGLVVKVEVAEGDPVHPGQGLVIVEAMKMENELRAEAGARVSRVHVRPGQAVEKDQVLVEFHDPEAEGAS
jgi:biotin carboxyl carrier protein